jgi:hypothetical protein
MSPNDAIHTFLETTRETFPDAKQIRRKLSLDSIALDFKKAEIECRELETKLLDKEAYFFQTQVLRFIRVRRYALTLRNLANAIVGLPDLKCRQTLHRLVFVHGIPQRDSADIAIRLPIILDS